jgi:hypothetical protein
LFQVAITLGALAATGAVLWTTDGAGEAYPDTPESETQWLCRACGRAFRLTAAVVQREQRRAGGPTPLYCPECSKKEAYRAAVCGGCGTMFLGPDAPDSPGVCLQCYPDHGAGFGDDSEREASDGDAAQPLRIPNF